MVNNLVLQALCFVAYSHIFPDSRPEEWWTAQFGQLRKKLIPLKSAGEDLHEFYSQFCQFLRGGRTSGAAAALWRLATIHFAREKVYAKFQVFTWFFSNVFINSLLLTPERLEFLEKLEWLWGGGEEAFDPRHLNQRILISQVYLYLAETYTRDLLQSMTDVYHYDHLTAHATFGLSYLDSRQEQAHQNVYQATFRLRHCLLELAVLLPKLKLD